MSIAIKSAAAPMDLRALHERMGRVYHQPVSVHSFTNKRFTVNFRVPLEQLRRIVPDPIDLDEIGDTGLGMFSMCACDFCVGRIGWLPIPPVRNNDMLCRISTKIRKGGEIYRAYYTLRSDSSSRFLGFFGKRFSHFRKQIAEFSRVDDGTIYRLENRAADSLCCGKFEAVMASVTKQRPSTTIFSDVDAAKQLFTNGLYRESFAESERALRPLRILMRSQWEKSLKGLDAPVASPYATSFFTPPRHVRFLEEIKQSRPLANLVTDGSFELPPEQLAPS